MIRKSKIYFTLKALYEWILSWFFVPNWLIDSSCKSILDVACGQGLPMKLIKFQHNLYSVGVDVYKPYINKLKKERIHDEYLVFDARKLKFSDKSFDVVVAFQILEHLKKEDSLALLARLEKIAKKKIIISTPVGKTKYDSGDGNRYQKHQCYFYPKEFKKAGYKIIKMGGKSFFGEGGLAHRVKFFPFRELIFVLDVLLVPFYLLFQNKVDYYFFAYKSFDKRGN